MRVGVDLSQKRIQNVAYYHNGYESVHESRIFGILVRFPIIYGQLANTALLLYNEVTHNSTSPVGGPWLPMCMFNVPKLHNHSTLMVITSVLLWSMTNHFGGVAPWTKDTIQDPKIRIRIRFGYVLDMVLRKCVRSCLVIKITWFVQKCDLRAPCMPIDAPTYAQ